MKITVQLHDGRVVVGTVCAVEETVAGIKVRLKSGDCLLTVDAEQVVSIMRQR